MGGRLVSGSSHRTRRWPASWSDSVVAAFTVLVLLVSAHDARSADTTVFRGNYPGWPWVTSAPGGPLVCVWREGTVHEYSADGRILMSVSTDQGRAWSAARTIVDEPEVDDRNVAITCLDGQEWLLSYNRYTREMKSQVMTVRSLDGGRTWEKPQPVSDLDARTRAAIVTLRNGHLLLPYYRAPGDQSLVALSQDRGRTWETIEIPNGPGFVGDEWDVAELPDGRLVGIIRNSASFEDAADRGWFYQVTSRDRGRTWTPARRTNLRDSRSTSPAQIFVYEGRPVVLYSNARMVSVVMVVSDDPELVRWNVDAPLSCYDYRADRSPIQDGSYPVSVSVGGNRRLIVDYVHDGESRTISGYYVDLPAAWSPRR
jgi:hypothetical protein